tara:strand:- start:1884 stop:6788 length:4905 start_codon:yes stop_codon:yes gene_type:complete
MITLPNIFKSDIEGKNINVYPIISVGGELFISQYKESFDGDSYEDHNLKVSSIRESISLESRNFRISNVSISLSNLDDLADKLSSLDLMNMPVDIYWKSQSAKTLEDCLHVYRANIRRFSHDDKKIKLELEDSTQEKLKKDVPVANLAETQFVYSEKYINKYIPITYGNHDYAPAVLWKATPDDLDFQVISDDVYNITGSDHRGSIVNKIIPIETDDERIISLRADKGSYVHIYDDATEEGFLNPGEFGDTKCYEISDDRTHINCFLTFESTMPLNPFSADEFQGEFYRYPSSMDFTGEDGKYPNGLIGDDGAGEYWDWYDEESTSDIEAGIYTNIAGDITISNPNASFDKQPNIFNRPSNLTYSQIPDADKDTDIYIGAEEVDLFTPWKEENLDEWYALTEFNRESFQRSNINGGQTWVGGDIFDFMPTYLESVRFRAKENGSNEIFYNYGFSQDGSGNNVPHDIPSAPSDGHPEKFSYAGGTIGIDWTGYRRADLSYSVHDDDKVCGTYSGFGQESDQQTANKNMCLSGNNKYLGLATQSHNGDTSRHYEYDGSGQLEPSNFHNLFTSSIFDSQRAGGYHSGLNRIKYLHADELCTAYIQIPDAKTIMQRIAYLGIIDDFDYFTYRNDDFSGYGNQCRITNPQMDKCMSDFEHINEFATHPDYQSGRAAYLFTQNDFTRENYIHGDSLRWNQAMVAEDNYIALEHRRSFDNLSSELNIGYYNSSPVSHYMSDLDNDQEWMLNEYTIADGNWWSVQGFYNMQPPITGISPYGNVIWIFGIKENKNVDILAGLNSGEYLDLNNNADGHLTIGMNSIYRYITVTFCPTPENTPQFTWQPGAGVDVLPEYILDRIAEKTYDIEISVTGNGNVRSYEMTNEIDLETGMISGQKGHYALSELFYMPDFPLYIPYQRQETGMDFSDSDEGDKWISPAYKAFWNGKQENDHPHLHDNNGAYACVKGVENVSKHYDGGENRWFALSLKSHSNYTKAGCMLPCYTLTKEGGGSLFTHFSIGEGFETTFTTNDDFISLRAKQDIDTAKGKRIGFKFKLPDVDISDNISLAHHAYWMRKLEITQYSPDDYQGRDNGDTNHLECYASAYDYNEDDINDEDFLGTTTSLFKESFNTVSTTETDSPLSSIFINNIDNSNSSLSYDGQNTPFNTLAEDHDVSLFDGSLNSSHFKWGEPDDFSSFNLLILASKEEGSGTSDYVCNIKLYENYIRHVADFENLTESDFYVSTQGRMQGNGDQVINNPADIIRDLVYTELNLPNGSINDNEFNNATADNQSFKLGFSVKDKVDSKKLIENICTNTKMFPRINGQNTLGLITIKDDYNEDSDYNRIIEYNRILKYKFTRTKIDELKSKVMVMYNEDYAKGDFKNNTGWFSAKDFLGDGDLGFVHPIHADYGYRLDNFNLDEEDSKLIFEAKYIKDRDTAYKLQEFLTMWYCNQHTKISLDLDISYLNLEVGDIVKFDELINEIKAFGEDYTKQQYRNGQIIYPLFLIEEVVKTDKKVSINCIQLHKLSREYQSPPCGDTRRLFHYTGDAQFDAQQGFPFSMDDVNNINDYYYDGSDFTRLQIKQMDINGTYSVTLKDSLLYQERLSLNPPLYPWSDSDRFFGATKIKNKIKKIQQQEQQSSQ